MAYRNPLPVAVALQPVYDTQGTALVVITRTIAPARGGTALPGGFIDHREDWRHAVAREIREDARVGNADRVSAKRLDVELPVALIAVHPIGSPDDDLRQAVVV